MIYDYIKPKYSDTSNYEVNRPLPIGNNKKLMELHHILMEQVLVKFVKQSY